ncbi:AAA family ATPase [Vibrio cholerae]|uniref:AAA family ATPase n=1 Tax=Vibrio cholerae TaxID=666 RepID=UPI0028D974C6|nr:pilus assembly protein CpaE [Vibrio cholerae]
MMTDSEFKVVAFVLDEHSQQVFNQLSRELNGQDWLVKKGDIQAATQWCLKQGAPDVLVVDGGDCLHLESALNGLVQSCSPQTKLIVLGQKQDVSLYRRLLFAGINDYHSTPLDANALRVSLLHLQGHKVAKSLRQGRIVCVLGSAGGCGVSTIAANLGYCLAERQKQQVALVDLDLFHSQHPILLGADYEPHLDNILHDARRIDATLLAHSSHQFSERLHLFYSQDSQLSLTDIKQPAEAIRVLAEHYGTVIVDVPDLHHPAMLEVLNHADSCIYVTDYSLSSLRYLAKLRVRQSGHHQRTLLLGNQCRHSKGRVPKLEISKAAGLDIGFELPFDAKAFEKAERTAQPLLAQRSRLSKKLEQISQWLSSAPIEKGLTDV